MTKDKDAKGPGRAVVLRALRSAMDKWRGLSLGRGEDRGVHNCQLCQLFYVNNVGGNCDGCPVDTYTGGGGCGPTPFHGWVRATGEVPRTADTARARAWAYKEYAFLKEVRDAYLRKTAAAKRRKNEKKQ